MTSSTWPFLVVIPVTSVSRKMRAPRLLAPAARRGGGCHAQAAALPPASVLSGLVLEPPVQFGAVLHHARQVEVGAQLAHQASRMPRRAAGEFPALEEHNLLPPPLGEVVGEGPAADGDSDDAD